MASPKSTTTSLPHPISDLEAKHYYYGLYSTPVLVACTGDDIWEQPTGPEAYFRPKELRTIGNHPLKGVWEDKLDFQIHDILKCKRVEWTSTDVTQIGFIGECVTPALIWIGVKANTLSCEDSLTIAKECKQLLVANKILNVKVEIRESIMTRYISPKLQKSVHSFYPSAQLLDPLTSPLGPFNGNPSTPGAESTGGFYITDDNSQLYLVTARDVVFKPDLVNNNRYKCRFFSQLHVNVTLFSTATFTNYVAQIKRAIEGERITVEF
ncbi:hypothetical protein L873DRAFT_1805339 [Choiromyces venosus 120613-1]|uniref:Uncharacterized protein n=1 Tax=Choiromyces venosus 120613-1 TaxID=1336337 RepID=A0A3N4JQL6_9PEZI|nr:hypothetical protein L873DRAFT_1805339 [Choiromyces venosus 120613-1]